MKVTHQIKQQPRRMWRQQQHPDRRLYEENLLWRWIVLSGALAILGVVALALPFDAGSTWREMAAAIGTSLISLGAASMGFELLLRRAVTRDTLAAVGLETSLAQQGVLEFGSWEAIDFKAFFEANPGDIDICVTYGSTWARNNAERVLRAAVASGSRVRVTLLDPKPPSEPEYLAAFARDAAEGDIPELVRRIEDAIKAWRVPAATLDREGRAPRLQVEGIRALVPYTFYRSGDSMWVVFSSRRRQRVGGFIPVVRCVKTGDPGAGLYDWVMEDLEACRRDSVVREL